MGILNVIRKLIQPVKYLKEAARDVGHGDILGAAENYAQAVPGLVAINATAPLFGKATGLIASRAVTMLTGSSLQAASQATIAKGTTTAIKGVTNWLLQPVQAGAKLVGTTAKNTVTSVFNSTVNTVKTTPLRAYAPGAILTTAAVYAIGKVKEKMKDRKSHPGLKSPNYS